MKRREFLLGAAALPAATVALPAAAAPVAPVPAPLGIVLHHTAISPHRRYTYSRMTDWGSRGWYGMKPRSWSEFAR